MTITVSAPGKLMLFGEHAVVHERPCLVTAVDLRFFVTMTRLAEPQVRLHITQGAHQETHTLALAELQPPFAPNTAFVLTAVQQLYTQYGFTDGLQISTQGPATSYGLGSSSAITVATVKALAALYGLALDERALFAAAYQAVLAAQGGIASGFDVAAAIYGGTLRFRAGGAELQPLALPPLPLVIGFSGSKVSTMNYVKQVTHLHTTYPHLVNPYFDLLARMVDDAQAACLQQDWATVGNLANLAQGLLDGLGVNTLPLAKLIFAARQAGAYGAKLSGAGGGDCMFAITPPDQQNVVENALVAAGGEIVRLPTQAAGVRIE
jgi:mevalonate kinase